ncbi:MAG: 50S ribosomal protein L18e [Candidatus Bathycorpusculaceae bacterium]
MKKVKTTNPELRELISFLKRQSREHEAEIWKAVAERLSSSRRKRIAVNISRLNRNTKKNEIITVPGKVLGAGELDHPITVAAFAFSETAKGKIKKAKGKCLSLFELVKKNPKGSNVKIIG